jgi:GntR family transcriptional repressor for pyruvate dehydrogenase complex
MNDIPVLSSLDDSTLSAKVARHLLERITREGLRPGDLVPSEVQIGRELVVSRGSVREAYRSLAALGILEIGSGRRPRLKAMNSAVVTQVFGYALKTAQVTVQQVMETRRAIEIQSAQLAATRATEPQCARLRELVGQMRAALGDHARRIAADMALHTMLAEASQNPLNALLLDALRDPLEQSLFIDLGQRRSDSELVRIVDAHEAIVERVCARDAIGAGAAMSMHFDMSVNTMMRDEGAVALAT